MNIENVTRCISESISNVSASELSKAVVTAPKLIDGTASESEINQFYSLAQCIVEPEIDNDEDQDEYYDYMDKDMNNWSNWISNTFGDEWGIIANTIKEYGY